MSSSILRPEILVIGNRSYRINPSSLPGLEPIDNQQLQVYREEEEADYYVDNLDNDEPSCNPQQISLTNEPERILQSSVLSCILNEITFTVHEIIYLHL